MARRRRVAVALLACALGAAVAAAGVAGAPGAIGRLVPPAGAATATTVAAHAATPVRHLHFRLGPLDIHPGQNLIETTRYQIPEPSEDGWVVGFRPNLRLANGQVPRVDVLHLHHGVWLNARKRDATAPLFPERFFAAGEEKTALSLPNGFGYPFHTTDAWILNYMIHDLTPKPFRVWVTYDVDFVPASSVPAGTITDVHPVWVDVQNNSTYPVFDAVRGSGTGGRFTYPDQATDPYPPGVHKNEYVLPRDGVLVETGGHLHPGGLYDTLTLQRGASTATLFHSRAHYYEPAGAVSWDVAMTVTPPTWRVAVHAGDVLAVHTTYDTSHASWYESMGLMIAWMADTGTGADPFTTDVDVAGHLTHGHLPENRNHGGAPTRLENPLTAAATPAPGTVDILGFVYGDGDLSTNRPIPSVRAGQSLEFANSDAAKYGVWHSITACQAPCTASTGIAYPIANGAVTFDSGQLGVHGPPTAGRVTWTTPTDLAPGTYTYFCRVHPFMRGAFRVVAPGG